MNIFEAENFDEYIFLLSSDWCSSFLTSDLELCDEDIQIIKNVARSAVAHIIESATGHQPNYNFVDLSIKRKQKTWELFCERLNSKVLEKKISLYIRNELSDPHSEDITLDAFLMLLKGSVDDNKIGDIDLSFLAEKKIVLTNLIRDSNDKELDDYEEIASTSNSDWDKYLISLTPDMPTALSDFYQIKISDKKAFKKIWSKVKLILNDNEKEKLLKKLVDKYVDLTGYKCSLADWL